MQMVSKFDLRCTNVNNISNNQQSSNVNSIEPSAEMIQDALIPSNAKDMELFLNLIEFTKLFLKKCKPKHFIRWNYIFSKLLIEKATQYSYISGFYKLLSVAMRISDKYEYFEDINERSVIMKESMVKQESQSMLDDTPVMDDEQQLEDEEVLMRKLFTVDYNTRVTCFQYLLKFVKENVIQRL